MHRRHLTSGAAPNVYVSNNGEVSYDDLPEDPILIQSLTDGGPLKQAASGIFIDIGDGIGLTVEDNIELE